MVADLPELLAVAFQAFRRLGFQHVDGLRERIELRLRDKNMHVFRHQDVPKDEKLVTLPHTFEFFFKAYPCVAGVEVRKPALTTEGKEVIASVGLEPLETTGHEDIVNLKHPPPPIRKVRVWMGHPAVVQ
jgi:hypothetical protein